MELTDYQLLVSFLSSGCSIFPDYLQDTSTKEARNKRDNFRKKGKKFFLNGDVLFRFIPGNGNGAEVVIQGREKDILAEFHGSAFGGHSGVNKTVEAIKSRYWWFGLTDDVSYPFELVGVDLIGPLQETDQGNKYIFTATDYYTKWVEAFPIPSKHATVVAQCFEKLIARHGAMNAILTDQGREFLNEVNNQLCKEWNIQHRVTAAYHPQTNGLDERTNQTLKASLRKMVNEHQTDWDNFLEGALFAQRTKPQSSTKYSPFFLLYGREAVYPSQLPKNFGTDEEISLPSQPSEEELDSFVKQCQETKESVNSKVSANINKAKEKQKKDYQKKAEKGRPYTHLEVGHSVMVYNSKKASTKQKGNMQPNYDGPYKIVDLTGKLATLQNESGLVLKKINIDRLKLFTTPSNQSAASNKSTNQSAACNKSTNQINTDAKDLTIMTKVNAYLEEISANGSLQELIKFVTALHFTKVKTVYDLHHLIVDCPLQSFMAETTRDAEAEMDAFASRLITHLRHLNISLTEKTTAAMLLSCVCVKAAKLFQPVLVIAETLKEHPCHLQDMNEGACSATLQDCQRLFVGGETIEALDLETLNDGEWLSDKIINSFLGLLKLQKNKTESHMFFLPSYTAVLWNEGKFEHWMFKKFAMYTHILLPVSVNGNHWVLMVVNVRQRTVTVLDSMHGHSAEKCVALWRQFMQKRDGLPDMKERFGEWLFIPLKSSPQTDGNSCGVFTLMNAECIVQDVPVQVMRQIHCKHYRQYVKSRLFSEGKTKTDVTCDMPDCKVKKGVHRWVQCCVCGSWFHTKCCGLPTQAAIGEEYECCFCTAMYR